MEINIQRAYIVTGGLNFSSAEAERERERAREEGQPKGRKGNRVVSVGG